MICGLHYITTVCYFGFIEPAYFSIISPGLAVFLMGTYLGIAAVGFQKLNDLPATQPIMSIALKEMYCYCYYDYFMTRAISFKIQQYS